jgi:hypothetical protein
MKYKKVNIHQICNDKISSHMIIFWWIKPFSVIQYFSKCAIMFYYLIFYNEFSNFFETYCVMWQTGNLSFFSQRQKLCYHSMKEKSLSKTKWIKSACVCFWTFFLSPWTVFVFVFVFFLVWHYYHECTLKLNMSHIIIWPLNVL